MNVLRVTVAVAACLLAGSGGAWAAEERAGAAPNVVSPVSAATAKAAPRGILASTAAPLETEENLWPFFVSRSPTAALSTANTAAKREWTAVGPLAFTQPDSDGGTAHGVRPFWVQRDDAQGRLRAGYFLYPLFSYTEDENTYKWSVFELVRHWGRSANAAAPQSIFEPGQELEIFPFWFSRQTGDPELNYRALFPIHGTIKNKLFFERLSWTLFPLYVRNEKRGVITTSTPWPFIRVTRGAAHGWGVWPLFNYVERPGVSREEFYLWPFGYNVTRLPSPDAPPGTPSRRDIGVLPFYARSTGPGYINEDFLWPFFGYTDRQAPADAPKRPEGLAGMFHRAPPGRYHETRYFWPFLVQGRGVERSVNRWAPFYTHSISKGYDKTWYMWPLVRHARWGDEGVARQRTQFFYFLYWSETQRAAGRANSPATKLTHVWPFYSQWDNGAGRKQLQIVSPFEVFFPGNEKVRLTWSPIFSLARHERRAPGESRTSVLWNAITWEHSAAEERKELHVGPIFSIAERSDGKRVAVGNGLFGFKRGAAGTGWRMFWWDFQGKPATPASR